MFIIPFPKGKVLFHIHKHLWSILCTRIRELVISKFFLNLFTSVFYSPEWFVSHPLESYKRLSASTEGNKRMVCRQIRLEKGLSMKGTRIFHQNNSFPHGKAILNRLLFPEQLFFSIFFRIKVIYLSIYS